MIMMNKRLHIAITEVAHTIRDRFDSLDIGNMHFEIEVEGRVNGGDVKITYGVGKYHSEVKGGDVEAVLNEYCRRHGWEERNAPVMLESPNAHVMSDEF